MAQGDYGTCGRCGRRCRIWHAKRCSPCHRLDGIEGKPPVNPPGKGAYRKALTQDRLDRYWEMKALGLNGKEIAEQLGITHQALKNYLHNEKRRAQGLPVKRYGKNEPNKKRQKTTPS